MDLDFQRMLTEHLNAIRTAESLLVKAAEAIEQPPTQASRHELSHELSQLVMKEHEELERTFKPIRDFLQSMAERLAKQGTEARPQRRDPENK